MHTHFIRRLLTENLLHVLQFVDCGVVRDVSTTVTTPASNTDDDWKTIKHWPDGRIPYDFTDAMYGNNILLPYVYMYGMIS